MYVNGCIVNVLLFKSNRFLLTDNKTILFVNVSADRPFMPFV